MLLCPVCKSREIYPVTGGYIGQVYFCKECKYHGSFVLEVDEVQDRATGESDE